MKEEELNPVFDGARKRKRFILILIIVLCFLYVLFAVRPLSSEIHFVPMWTIDVNKNTKNDRLTEKTEYNFNDTIPFKMGQSVGYFTKNGVVLSSVTFPYKAAVSSEYYSLYDTHSPNVPIYLPNGKEISSIHIAGFPYFDEDRIFHFLPGGSSFAKIEKQDSDDKTNFLVDWIYEGYAPITAFSSSESGILVGFADGNLIAFTPDGKVDSEFVPGGSTYSVILGAGISKSGRFVAAVSGQQEQRFVLAEKKNGMTSVIFHKYLEKELNRQTIVKFSRNEDSVYYSYAGGLGIVNCRTFKESSIKIEGVILSIQEDTDGTIFVLSREGKQYTVSVVEPFDVHSGSFSFDAETAFIAVKNGSLFVGHDSKISRIDIEHK